MTTKISAISTTATIFGGLSGLLYWFGHFTLAVVFGVIFIFLLVVALLTHRGEPKKKTITPATLSNPTKTKPFKLTPTHISILRVFREYSNELVSTPIIEELTGLEPIIINSILGDFKQHKIANPTNLDDFNGGWQWQLTDKGVKTIIKYT